MTHPEPSRRPISPYQIAPNALARHPIARSFVLAFAALAALAHAPARAADSSPSATAVAPATQPVTLPRAAQFDVVGPRGDAYRIWVAEPSGSPAAPPASGYATLVVLDANAMFNTVVEAVRFQKGQVPTLVIGVGYPADQTVDVQRRYRDFTPVTPAEHIWSSGTPGEARAMPESTGGEEAFLDFLEQTVRPAVATMYPLDGDRRVLMGHSLAGRLVLHAMFTRPAAYTHYVAASPSIWWDDRSVLEEADAFIARRTGPRAIDGASPVSALITAAEFEQRAAPGTPPGRVRFFEMAKMVDNARDLAARLSPLAARGDAVTFIEFKDENHGSVVPAVISRSLRFALAAPTTMPATTRPGSAEAAARTN